jgi:hypothetical protein
MRRRHIRPVIPTRKDQPRQRNFDRAAYRLRNKIEQLINRLKQARRIATRYEKRGDNYLAMIHVGMILLWISRLQTRPSSLSDLSLQRNNSWTERLRRGSLTVKARQNTHIMTTPSHTLSISIDLCGRPSCSCRHPARIDAVA